LKETDAREFLTPEAWEARYATGETGWDIGRAAPPLERLLDAYRPAGLSALVPGCGRGHEARLLSALGADPVVAVDFSPRALEQARAIQPALSARVTWALGDVRRLPELADGAFDLVVEHTCFCALAPDDRPAYMSQIAAALRPSGHLVGLFFVDFDNPDGPPFGVSQADLRRLLDPDFLVIHWEKSPPDSAQGRAGKEALIVARRRET
jgi:SAM-dependent methyltransferase